MTDPVQKKRHPLVKLQGVTKVYGIGSAAMKALRGRGDPRLLDEVLTELLG